MNNVNVIGRIVGEPDLRKNRANEDECRMTLAVARRLRDGTPDAGVVYLDVTTFGVEAREVAQQHEGTLIGLSGRLDSDPPHSGIGVLIDQLSIL
jgi:single-stranded DNA-binding protein